MNLIWIFGRGSYKGYTENRDVARRIMRWSSVEQCSIYYSPSMQIFAFDFIFPTRTYNRIARELGLPGRRKSPARIKQGQKIQRLLDSNRIDQVKLPNLTSPEV